MPSSEIEDSASNVSLHDSGTWVTKKATDRDHCTTSRHCQDNNNYASGNQDLPKGTDKSDFYPKWKIFSFVKFGVLLKC